MRYLLLSTVLSLAIGSPLSPSENNVAQLEKRQSPACAAAASLDQCNAFCTQNANSGGACVNCCQSIQGDCIARAASPGLSPGPSPAPSPAPSPGPSPGPSPAPSPPADPLTTPTPIPAPIPTPGSPPPLTTPGSG
ncbi:hypothetical protein FB567DRAFT_555464 [Paraphoma chrysanthemicola]|uniref:Uncharacterized protein n=1 Tax=Paraphoma chrysanthemicola TaxID=798071 RepID=A0A8K0QSB6_9PLEO|nr:hypothetical protein FB567DRAFT_555464 [Paraphoma chrysanthemicola]